MKRWSYSLLLLLMYLAAFHAWMHLPRLGIIVSGILVAGAATALFLRFRRRGYFHDRCDQFAHGAVILDLLLEAILIPVHDHHGFYWCAAGFAAVIIVYRTTRSPTAANRETSRPPKPNSPTRTSPAAAS